MYQYTLYAGDYDLQKAQMIVEIQTISRLFRNNRGFHKLAGIQE